MIIGHGGNIHEVARRLGCAPADIEDMSSNMNPMGPPPGLVEHLTARMSDITALPQADAADCVAAFARRHDLSADRVAAANGTTQFIYALPQALTLGRVLILGPTYADYADACRAGGTAPDFFLASPETGFLPDMARLAVAVQQADTVFVCNPNNPTGALIPRGALEALCRSFPEKRFVVDEAYMPFVDAEAHFSMADAGLPNVIVLNSMSKIFRIPGLRIGFLVAHPDVVEALKPALMPWSVNSLAQAAILYLMEVDVERFVEETRRFLGREKQALAQRFSGVGGIRLFPSTTSFVLARLDAPHTADGIVSAMLAHRILLRNCANFTGLSDRFVRISLKDPRTNARMADRLMQAVSVGFTAQQRKAG